MKTIIESKHLSDLLNSCNDIIKFNSIGNQAKLACAVEVIETTEEQDQQQSREIPMIQSIITNNNRANDGLKTVRLILESLSDLDLGKLMNELNYLSQPKVVEINHLVKILKKTLKAGNGLIVTFDSKEDEIDFILDICNKFKVELEKEEIK